MTAPPMAKHVSSVMAAADVATDITVGGSDVTVGNNISSFLLHIRRQAAGDTPSSSPAVAGGSADGVMATADSAADSGMHGASGASVTKKRRQKHSRATQDSRKHRRRMAHFAAAQGGTSGSDPGPIEGHPAGDRTEW